MSSATKQLSLFDKPELPPADPHVVQSDAKRLSGQNAAILRRRKMGAASSLTLAGISLKYTSRISDLRKHGFKIVCERTHSGQNLYKLEE